MDNPLFSIIPCNFMVLTNLFFMWFDNICYIKVVRCSICSIMYMQYIYIYVVFLFLWIIIILLLWLVHLSLGKLESQIFVKTKHNVFITMQCDCTDLTTYHFNMGVLLCFCLIYQIYIAKLVFVCDLFLKKLLWFKYFF